MDAVEIRAKWRPVPGWAGYEVSDQGEVRSTKAVGFAARPTSPRLLKAAIDADGYRRVQLKQSGKRRSAKIAWLVLEVFRGPRPVRLDACHNDGCRTNDLLKNLRWDTRKANLADRHEHGTMNHGERNGNASLTATEVRAIRAAEGSQTEIAACFGVTQTTVSRIKRGVRWAHIA